MAESGSRLGFMSTWSMAVGGMIGGGIFSALGVVVSIAGEKAFGTIGLIVVTIAAAFSTGSAINATLFSTARLSEVVAKDGELPAVLDHRNGEDVPDRAVIVLGAAAALLAAIGSLTMLVEGASLAFLFTFAVVCGIAWKERAGKRLLTGLGCVSAGAATIALIIRQVRTSPVSLLVLAVVVLISVVGRPIILRGVRTE